MKKLFVLMFAMCVVSTTAFAQDASQQTPPKKCGTEISAKAEHRAQREANFERRLKLTEVQKLKARELRKEGHAKLKPIMDQIRAKRQEAEMVRLSRISVQAQEEKLAVIDEELKVLEKQAQEIRKANMKAFEGILTREQKKVLKEMKKEGRARYYKNHPEHKHHPAPHRPMPVKQPALETK